MLNYAFGHFESTLHLLPVAPSVTFINHGPSPTRSNEYPSAKTANVYLDWSTHEHVYNDHGLHETPLSDWVVGEIPSIVMVLVALRDIEEGEELLLDYGRQWEKSWKNYMADWQEMWNKTGVVTKKSPRRAHDMLQLYKDQPFPIDIRIGQKPYPDGVVSGAYLGGTPTDVPDGSPRRNEKNNDILVWNGPATADELTGQTAVICDVLHRTPIYDKDGTTIVTYNYTILTRLKNDGYENTVQILHVPHYAMTLIDRPYSSDLHSPSAFRHWIGIRDNIFPQVWRDLR
jgi:hypothetical protein